MRRAAVPGGAAGGALGAGSRPGAWGPRPAPSPPPPRPASPAPPSAAATRASRGSVLHPRLRAALRAALRASTGPGRPASSLRDARHGPARAPQAGGPGARGPGRRGGRLCKVPSSLVTLRCRCARLSRDVLAREVALPRGGCGDARGLPSSPVVSESLLPQSPRAPKEWEVGASVWEAHALTFPWRTQS